MGRLAAMARRHGLRFALALVALTIMVGCQRFESDQAEPAPVATASEHLPSDFSVAPTATPSTGIEVIEGRPYVRRPLQGATLRHEAWVDVRQVRLVEEAYALTQRLLRDELGITDLPLVDIYLTLSAETERFALAHEFQHPSWLGGFYYYIVRDGAVQDAEVFVNVDVSGSTPHTVGHELTHLTTPLAPHWLSEGVAEYIGSRVGTSLAGHVP